MSSKTRRISLTTLRIILGIIFLLSGVGKLISSGQVRYLIELMATKFYWLIEYVGPIVLGITILELLLSAMLFWGKKIRWTLSICMILILIFTGILSYFYAQGWNVKSCGCFGAFDIGGGLTFGIFKNLILIIIIGVSLFLSRDKKTIKPAPATEMANP